MKLYCTIYDTGGPFYGKHFTGTQAEQKAFNKQVHKAGNEVTESRDIDVPTDKAGLLLFLNTCVIADEGKLSYETLP